MSLLVSSCSGKRKLLSALMLVVSWEWSVLTADMLGLLGWSRAKTIRGLSRYRFLHAALPPNKQDLRSAAGKWQRLCSAAEIAACFCFRSSDVFSPTFPRWQASFVIPAVIDTLSFLSLSPFLLISVLIAPTCHTLLLYLPLSAWTCAAELQDVRLVYLKLVFFGKLMKIKVCS